MDILTTFEILGATSATGLTYLTAQSYGLGAKYWTLKDPDERRAHRDAARVRRTWRRLARHLKLYLKDDMPTVRQALMTNDTRASEPTIKTPKIKHVETDSYGLTIDFDLVAGVKLKHFQDAAEDLANYWRMTRVACFQPESNRVRVRAVRRDPLATPLLMTAPRQVRSLRYYTAGVDEYGQAARVRLHNASGLGVYGLPTYGKTSFILGLITWLAQSPAVQFLIADGKVETGHEGDYLDVAPRALSVIGDDLETFNTWIKQINAFARMRSSTIRQTLGVKNVWDLEFGPTPEWPLIPVIIDEGHTFFEIIRDGGDPKLKARNKLAAENAHEVAELVKKRRSAGIWPIIATQKGTGDAIPTMIRDNLSASICFAVKTNAAAEAALGEGIKEHPDANPVQYQAEEYIGVASMVAERRAGFTRFRSPLCREAIAAAICDQTAELVAPQAVPGLTVGMDHLAQLPAGASTALLQLEKGSEN